MAGTDTPIKLSLAMMTLLDPARGAEKSFNRYYERERFYAAVMLGPSALSGGRFIARRSDKLARRTSDPATDIERGSFLNLYWVIGDGEDLREWIQRQTKELEQAGRTNWDRVPYWAFRARFEWSASRDEDGVPPELVLEHRYLTLVLGVVRPRAGHTASEAAAWYREHVSASTLQPGSAAAACLAFTATRGFVPLFPGDMPTGQADPQEDVLLLWFLESPPEVGWDQLVAAHEAGLADNDSATAYWMSRFIASNPGTDDYVTDIWL